MSPKDLHEGSAHGSAQCSVDGGRVLESIESIESVEVPFGHARGAFCALCSQNAPF